MSWGGWLALAGWYALTSRYAANREGAPLSGLVDFARALHAIP